VQLTRFHWLSRWPWHGPKYRVSTNTRREQVSLTMLHQSSYVRPSVPHSWYEVPTSGSVLGKHGLVQSTHSGVDVARFITHRSPSSHTSSSHVNLSEHSQSNSIQVNCRVTHWLNQSTSFSHWAILLYLDQWVSVCHCAYV